MNSLVAVVVLALVASACAGRDGHDDNATQHATPAPAVVVDASPLEEAVGFSSEPGRRNQLFVVTQRRANESAVQCMHAAGFTYFVEPVSAALVFGTRIGDGSRSWVEVNGLGIMTALVELSNLDDSERFDAATANADYTATLTADQTIAYDTALIGTGPLSVDQDLAGFSPDGCWGQAYFDMVQSLRAMSEFGPDLDLLNVRIEQDPRVSTLVQSWSECMHGRGRLYATRGEMIDVLFSRLLSVDFSETETGLEFGDPDAVEELLAIEIDVALDDFDCRSDIADPLEVIRDDYERRFVDDNRSRISAFAAIQQD